jgi:hypothetical protein
MNALNVWPLVIELGAFELKSIIPAADLIWFLAGLLLLAGSSAAVLWWNRQAQSDPFV